MSSPAKVTPEEAFVERLKAARRSSAVLKAKLITLRSDLPDVMVLAFEGDDEIIYGQWIRRIRPGLRYEPFPCGGKKEVKGLKNSLNRDLDQLGKNVFFFVDRDYDDLMGFDSPDGVFMTDTYAVENYLVTDGVLQELLRDEFPCHARPDLRQDIVRIFNEDYAKFLRLTAAINKRLYVARRVPVELAGRLPKGLRSLAKVQIQNVEGVNVSPEEVVVYKREPALDETVGLAEAFDQLEPRLRYRGKFAIKFFLEWLNKLAEEFVTGALGIFGDTKPEGQIRRGEFVLSNLLPSPASPLGYQSSSTRSVDTKPINHRTLNGMNALCPAPLPAMVSIDAVSCFRRFRAAVLLSGRSPVRWMPAFE